MSKQDLLSLEQDLRLSSQKGIQGSTLPFFENQLFSYKEAARYLSISEVYLRRLKRQGKIPFVRMGRRGVRFRLSSLDSWVEEREVK
ncbi:MAG: hypothetical protein A2428_00910 [Bdellovibrionales bacterium RIFOXYC1_FULL_54_43]|nr:MAG: hypothetical protein A2428_00910 [Bdellovibrionales bacterium RIFOXYC1_FULL_54_43]OFZ82845.1 MAG: hypothetical protein A2603_11635 [Bdellovibrionales bacterium RIFOXYD1_FULL_55_31]